MFEVFMVFPLLPCGWCYGSPFGVVKEVEGDLTFCGCDGPSGCAVWVICESCDCDSCGC